MKNNLLMKLKGHSDFLTSVKKCEKEVTPILQKFLTNFPDFTDHSIEHSKRVIQYTSDLIGNNVNKLNDDEIYILLMACYLHDIGMSQTKKELDSVEKSKEFEDFKKQTERNVKEYLREIHHKLSYDFIIKNWEKLGILNKIYAKAIALVAMGHRKEDLMNFDVFEPDYVVKSGSDFVCLPFLAGILRLADELDITNDRTPDLLFDKYLPESDISKREWLKHKSNYFVNFKDSIILITSKCSNQILYESLLKQYKKIEETMKYVQKITRYIPRQNLKINFSILEKKIETEGFIPKGIGFSFDLNNTMETFTGKNLYNSKFVTIREVLQNSIDTCRYKKVLKTSFKPEIKIILEEDKIIVEDNGLGMDEFIVENYFARLAKSYYTEDSVRGDFESISEFGIGIFSYFLLCDFFEVETKMEGKESLRFRVTKNPESNFFFYDDVKRKEEGTKITLFLKEKLPFDELKKQVHHYLRFVEIPIIIKSEFREEDIKRQDFKLSKKNDLKKSLNLLYRGKIIEFDIISEKIDTENYTGVCGLIINKQEGGLCKPKNIYDAIKVPGRSIDICHKGIFVNTFDSRFLSYLIGKINLKKKDDLNLSRTQLLDWGYLQNVISDFESKIVGKLFEKWKGFSLKDRAQITKLFIRYYIDIYQRFADKFSKTLINNFVLKTYDNQRIKYIELKKFLKEKKEFIIVNDNRPYTRGDTYDFRDIDEIYDVFKIPIIMTQRDFDDTFYLNLFRSLNLSTTINSNDKNWFYVIHNEEKKHHDIYVLDNYRDEALFFDNKHISAFPHIGLVSPLNINHPITKFTINNENKIKKNQEIFELFQSFFENLNEFIFYFHGSGRLDPKIEIQKLNKILMRVNRKLNKNFRLSEKDFPIWMRKKYDPIDRILGKVFDSRVKHKKRSRSG